jgi:hypothetical protein
MTQTLVPATAPVQAIAGLGTAELLIIAIVLTLLLAGLALVVAVVIRSSRRR